MFLDKLMILARKGWKEPEKILEFLIYWPRYRYLQYKHRNKPYIEFYREVMKIRSSIDPVEAVGGKCDEMGDLQFEYLLRHGLRREDRLLDFGCGCLRAGRYLIKYLKERNYYGIDISPEILKEGEKSETQDKECSCDPV